MSHNIEKILLKRAILSWLSGGDMKYSVLFTAKKAGYQEKPFLYKEGEALQ